MLRVNNLAGFGVGRGGGGVDVVTWNPADKGSGVTLSNGDLTATGNGTANGGPSVYDSVRATGGYETGKRYFEYTHGTTDRGVIGLDDGDLGLSFAPGAQSIGVGYISDLGMRVVNGTNTNGWGATWTSGDIIGVAVDLDTGKVWFAKNNVWQASGNPAAGTNPATTLTAGTLLYPMVGLRLNGNNGTANFNGPFTYTLPTGFTGWGG